METRRVLLGPDLPQLLAVEAPEPERPGVVHNLMLVVDLMFVGGCEPAEYLTSMCTEA